MAGKTSTYILLGAQISGNVDISGRLRFGVDIKEDKKKVSKCNKRFIIGLVFLELVRGPQQMVLA